MDIWTKEKRSEVMAKIRSKNSKPELIVRSLLYHVGYRYNLLEKFADQSDKLFLMDIICTDSFTGELDEDIVKVVK